MAEGRFQRWRIDRKIPFPVWIAFGGIGVIAILLGEAMLINAVASYQPPLAQYAQDHRQIDEAKFKSLQPVTAPTEWAYWEGTFGNRSLIVGLVLATMAAMVRLSTVRLRWLVLRSLGALILAVCSGVTLVNVVPAHELEYFYYVNSGACVQGCWYIPEPIGGWFGTVAIAVIVSVLLCVALGAVTIARSLPRTRPKAVELTR
jgi:hypothetical protein